MNPVDGYRSGTLDVQGGGGGGGGVGGRPRFLSSPAVWASVRRAVGIVTFAHIRRRLQPQGRVLGAILAAARAVLQPAGHRFRGPAFALRGGGVLWPWDLHCLAGATPDLLAGQQAKMSAYNNGGGQYALLRDPLADEEGGRRRSGRIRRYSVMQGNIPTAAGPESRTPICRVFSRTPYGPD